MQHASDISQAFSVDLWIGSLALPALYASLDYRILSTNSAAAKLLGYQDTSQLVGTGLRAQINKDEAAKFFSDLILLEKDDGGLHETFVNLQSASGSLPFKVTPMRGAKNAILGFFLQHIADEMASSGPRERFEVPPSLPVSGAGGYSLAESEWVWKMALLSANQGVWDHDFERDRHYLSQTWRDLRGLSLSDPIPTATEEWRKTIHPQDIDHIEEELRKLDTGETDIVNYKFRQRHALGHWVWFYSSGRVVRRDQNGLPARIIGTDTDISEIKKVEMESDRMAYRLDAALKASGMARWEFDVDAKITFWDDRALEMAGIEDGMHIRSTQDWIDTIHPQDRRDIVALTHACVLEHRDIECEYRVLRPDGTVRYVRFRGVFAKNEATGPRYYGVKMDITEERQRTLALEEARGKLEHESLHDALTGLANRRFLDDTYTSLAQDKAAIAERVAVLHFDIDHFKQINDTLGHDAGDALLKHAADILEQSLPTDTLVSRVGGDEFVALLANAPDAAELKKIAAKIIDAMAQPYFYKSQLCNIGTSIGVAVSAPGTPLNGDLFIHADLALYEAKKAGRGRFRFFNDAMQQEARRRKNSFDALLEGFDQGEITCHYQPQFDAKTLAITGVEALVRWESRKFGLMMPDEFLGTASDMGLVAEFDELVLRKALSDLRKWEDNGLWVPRISVNVSSHRLNDPALGQRLAKLKLPKGRLAFELLESAFLDSRNEVIDRNLTLLDDLGIEIEIDDFGSGHASIVSLLQIAPKRLKIDRMLVAPAVKSARQRDLLARIIDIGKMLGVNVIAEGVETAQHVAILRQMGCCDLQGFGLARPMDCDAFMSLLRDLKKTDGRLQRLAEPNP